MATTTQVIKMKCPHCGWVRRIEIDVEAGQTDVIAGIGDFFKRLSATWREKIQPLLKDRQLDEANAWLPMPPCPNPEPACGKTYEYNIYSGETRK